MCFRTTIPNLVLGFGWLGTEAHTFRYIAKPPAQRPRFEKLGPSLFGEPGWQSIIAAIDRHFTHRREQELMERLSAHYREHSERRRHQDDEADT